MGSSASWYVNISPEDVVCLVDFQWAPSSLLSSMDCHWSFWQANDIFTIPASLCSMHSTHCFVPYKLVAAAIRTIPLVVFKNRPRTVFQSFMNNLSTVKAEEWDSTVTQWVATAGLRFWIPLLPFVCVEFACFLCVILVWSRFSCFLLHSKDLLLS